MLSIDSNGLLESTRPIPRTAQYFGLVKCTHKSIKYRRKADEGQLILFDIIRMVKVRNWQIGKRAQSSRLLHSFLDHSSEVSMGSQNHTSACLWILLKTHYVFEAFEKQINSHKTISILNCHSHEFSV
jgi:hypothetical protein